MLDDQTITPTDKFKMLGLLPAKVSTYASQVKQFYTKRDIEKRLEKFVVVKVMREDPNATAGLPPIEGVPTVFFMNEKKTVTETVLGYRNVRKFTAVIDSVEKK